MTPALPALPGTLSIAWGLGTVAVVVGVGSVYIITAYRRRRPLRQEMQARSVTYVARVDVKGFTVRGLRGTYDLTVHGDMFEVSAVPLPGLLGDQWIYRATDTTMRVVPGWQHDWIEIAAQPPAGRARPIRVSAPAPLPRGRWGAPYPYPPWLPREIRDAPYPPWMTREIWDALVRAGVHPVGAPPL